MDGIKLNLINKSAGKSNNRIVIFQKNILDFTGAAVAWRIIKNLGREDNHPFIYPYTFQIGASDSYGNYTPHLSAQYGQAFEMIKDSSGDILQLANYAANTPNEIELKNNLTTGAINANCYKDGKLLATKTNIIPGEKAAFEFSPTIYIGVVSQIEEGEIMDAAILSFISTKINLLGITSADIVMTGGDTGVNATPYKFTLENITQQSNL